MEVECGECDTDVVEVCVEYVGRGRARGDGSFFVCEIFFCFRANNMHAMISGLRSFAF